MVVFEWDPVKNQTNIEKHGISFETAKRIFEGAMWTRLDERRDYGERRFIGIGEVPPAYLVVAYTVRDHAVRLISARPASQRERQAYHEQTR